MYTYQLDTKHINTKADLNKTKRANALTIYNHHIQKKTLCSFIPYSHQTQCIISSNFMQSYKFSLLAPCARDVVRINVEKVLVCSLSIAIIFIQIKNSHSKLVLVCIKFTASRPDQMSRWSVLSCASKQTKWVWVFCWPCDPQPNKSQPKCYEVVKVNNTLTIAGMTTLGYKFAS